MDDLISRAAAIAWFFRPYSNEESYSNLDVERALKAIPAVDAAQVVHGRPVWINPLDPDAKICAWKCSSLCSVCGDYVAVSWKYCPNCGARMDGERRDDDA